jgi:hypothetical protein
MRLHSAISGFFVSYCEQSFNNPIIFSVQTKPPTVVELGAEAGPAEPVLGLTTKKITLADSLDTIFALAYKNMDV